MHFTQITIGVVIKPDDTVDSGQTGVEKDVVGEVYSTGGDERDQVGIPAVAIGRTAPVYQVGGENDVAVRQEISEFEIPVGTGKGRGDN